MSVGTAMYREQHEHLRAVAAELVAVLDAGAHARDADHARLLLARLSGRLAVHLAMEDRSLYPFLVDGPEGPARDAARRLRAEQGGLRATFDAFTGRWPTAEAIEREPDAFAAGARALLAGLEARIRRENDELFPLAERAP